VIRPNGAPSVETDSEHRRREEIEKTGVGFFVVPGEGMLVHLVTSRKPSQPDSRSALASFWVDRNIRQLQ
jgi:hypothetical protein